MIVGIVVLSFIKFQPETQPTGILFAVLTGITATLGTFFFLYAVTLGKASVVVTITALYPLITIVLTFLVLREPITMVQGVGMALALIAMVLLAW